MLLKDIEQIVDYEQIEDQLVGCHVDVHVSVGDRKASKRIKVCKNKPLSIILIEVDRENRKNIFWKIPKEFIEEIGKKSDGYYIKIQKGIALSNKRWESDWSNIQ